MSRIGLAFSSFFSILFNDTLPEEAAKAYGYVKPEIAAAKPAPAAKAPEAPQAKTSDGALQMLGILQRDSRLIDFLMEDISGAADDQIGAAVRDGARPVPRRRWRSTSRSRPSSTAWKAAYTKAPSGDPARREVRRQRARQRQPRAASCATRDGAPPRSTCPPSPASRTPTIIAPAEIEIE